MSIKIIILHFADNGRKICQYEKGAIPMKNRMIMQTEMLNFSEYLILEEKARQRRRNT
jgi:hypothetical protein